MSFLPDHCMKSVRTM